MDRCFRLNNSTIGPRFVWLFLASHYGNLGRSSCDIRRGWLCGRRSGPCASAIELAVVFQERGEWMGGLIRWVDVDDEGWNEGVCGGVDDKISLVDDCDSYFSSFFSGKVRETQME